MKPNDIVQIIDEQDAWYPCLLIVDEVKSWGVQACVLIPNSNVGAQDVSRAFRRLEFNKIELVGSAQIGITEDEHV